MNSFQIFCFHGTGFGNAGRRPHFSTHAPLFNAPGDDRQADQCTYFMCEYEKSNIDAIILEHAKTCQTVMFGEIHDHALKEMAAPVEDSIYVAGLLARMRQIGYAYLALEVNQDAKVIVYIGAFHVGERETTTGIFMGTKKKRPLGYFLDRYTKGKNFSVYMGHTDDAPVGCDLLISYFIWDATQ